MSARGLRRPSILAPAPQDLEPGAHALLCIGPDWLALEGPLSLTR